MEISNWITLITGLLARLGIGSVVTNYIQHLLKQKENTFQNQRKNLERRYKAIILLTCAAFDVEKNFTPLRIQRPD